MNLQILFFDLLSNIFNFFILELFTLTFFSYTHTYQKTYYRKMFLAAYFITAILPSIPYASLLYIALDFCYFALISNFKLKESIVFCIKYELAFNLLHVISGIFCMLINFAIYNKFNSFDNIFFDYQLLIGTILAYILLNLHINNKRLQALHIKTIYPVTYSVLSTAFIFLMLFFNTLLAEYSELAPLLPWIYLSAVGIIVLSLNSYRNIIEILEEQTKQKLLVEKYELELSYFNDVQTSLDTLSRLRHDFKNHLIVLDSYASQDRVGELRDYISKVSSFLNASKLISTENDLVSSILNTKNAACEKKGISFSANCNFSHIHISDFAIITILGNILDNAITAASKTTHGEVEFSINELGGYLEISCQNNHDGNIKEKNGEFTSTKPDTGGLHGLGISNVRDCVNSLRGTTEISYDKDTFSVTILLPNHASHG